MRNFVWKLIRFMRLGPLMLYVHPKSALRRVGWFESFHKKKVVDSAGQAMPWWTYSFIDFISERLNDDLRVLEFGCGSSTIFLSKRVAEVVAVEDYPYWVKEIKGLIDASSRIIEVDSIDDYGGYKDSIEGQFDILIIDNLGNRMNCLLNNMGFLNSSGVVIWDNTDGPDWSEIKGYMNGVGFKDISFSGMTPQELALSRTTLFYRDVNCLSV